MMKHPNRVYMTKKDYRIISGLLSRLAKIDVSAVQRLADELDQAELFHSATEIPKDVVVMYSLVQYTNLTSNHVLQVQIVYPHEVDVSKNKVSILSPVGSALIGLREHDEIAWLMPCGQLNTLRVEKVAQMPD